MAGRRLRPPDWGQDHLSLDAVVAYVDDELTAAAHGRADLHLLDCGRCHAEVVAQRQARSALRTAAGPRLPSSLLHTLRAIPVEAELPPPPPGLGVTADGQFVLLRDVPPAAGPDVPPRRISRRARFGAVSGLAIGALAVGALAAPGPATPPEQGVLGGAVLNGAVLTRPGVADAALTDRGRNETAAARLSAVAPAPNLRATASGASSTESASDTATTTDGPDVLDATVRQRLDRLPAFHRNP